MRREGWRDGKIWYLRNLQVDLGNSNAGRVALQNVTGKVVLALNAQTN